VRKRGSCRPRAASAAAGALITFNSLSTLPAAEPTFRHDPPACVLADAFPRLVAQVDPPEQVSRVRVAFRPEAAGAWHGVAAEPVEGGFAALLPRPRLAARRIHYRFEATGPDASVVRSAEYAAAVVADAAACGGAVADSVPSASVLVDVPPGAPVVPPVPAGFDPVGAVASAPHKGAGKRKIGLLAGVVVGGAAVAGVVVAAKPEDEQVIPQMSSFQVRSSTPPPFGQVSISGNNMSVDIAAVTARTLPAGEAWLIIHNNGTNPAERPCAVLAGPYPAIQAGQQAQFTVRTPFLAAAPCGTANLARIVFRNSSGQQIYESGGPDFPDASVAYTFVP
jgi:hypothetical protein